MHCVILLLGVVSVASAQAFRAQIPNVWDDARVRALETPVVNPKFSPRHVDSKYYYRIPVLPIYRGYPVYAPGRGAEGCLRSLSQKEPEKIFDARRLKTKQDWVNAGEIVFHAATDYGGADSVVSLENVTDPEWYAYTRTPIASDGTLPWVQYVIRKKGKVELGILSCAFCHTRVLSDGSVITGGQGNLSFNKSTAFRERRRKSETRARNIVLSLFSVPWLPAEQKRLESLSLVEIITAHEAIPSGVLARNRSSLFFPPAVPDLFQLKDRRYLDESGLVQNRDMTDLMRYASMAQGIDSLSDYGGFIPFNEPDFKRQPKPRETERLSNEQLYALALYLETLQAPRNPNPPNEQLSERGKAIFDRQGCGQCHPSPASSLSTS